MTFPKFFILDLIRMLAILIVEKHVFFPHASSRLLILHLYILPNTPLTIISSANSHCY